MLLWHFHQRVSTIWIFWITQGRRHRVACQKVGNWIFLCFMIVLRVHKLYLFTIEFHKISLTGILKVSSDSKADLGMNHNFNVALMIQGWKHRLMEAWSGKSFTCRLNKFTCPIFKQVYQSSSALFQPYLETFSHVVQCVNFYKFHIDIQASFNAL